MYAKQRRYRNPAILNLARQIERCMSCGRWPTPGSIVAAHSNQGRHGKGMGLKAHDCFVAYLCPDCHDQVDAGRASATVARVIWEDGHRNSLPHFTHLLTAEGWDLLRADHEQP